MLVIRPGRCLGKGPVEALEEVSAALAEYGYVVELVPDAVVIDGRLVDVLPQSKWGS